MTAVKSSANDAVSVNAAVAGDLRDRKTMTSWKVLKEIETDLESNASSSEDMEYYSPKSVVAKKWPVTVKEVNLSGVRFCDQVTRIRAEDSQIGEDIGEFCIGKFGGAGNGRVDVMIFSRRPSPLSGKEVTPSIKTEH
ncbi:uncharacterized protein LOC112515461 [Cynara cardunculus var. scolymus]|uniref:uncharacterized protein LOC112515461 n=1 Tax=Cynara cardunculus var. scolymus TaxID=59895 RepID=UPI000D62C0E8|nr:uncharacterized protein LOC112515461 [Cynara cardunculus var. scolymus]